MLPAEGEITLALEAEETHLFLAFPAERFVSLYLSLISIYLIMPSGML